MKRILAAMMMGILLAHEIPVAAMRGEILYTEDVESGNENEEENAASAVEGPQIGAPSAILMEASTGKVIYEKDADKEMPPASVTKIMTLILIFDALEEGQIDLEDEVTTSEHASSMGGSQVFLEVGEKQTVDTMIKCIAVASANDACVAMAEHIWGSEEEFVNHMNERAKGLGMEHTHFVNCCGLDTDGHLTTARDIALMSQELITRYPQIEEYTMIWMENITHTTSKGSSEFGLTNTNKLVRQYEYTTGLKTGSTDKAKFCVSATARKNNIDLIAVIMAAPDPKTRFQDASALLNYGFGKCVKYIDDGSMQLDPVEIDSGEKKEIKIKQADSFCYIDTTGADLSKIEKKVIIKGDLKAPVKEGGQVGEVVYYIGEEKIGSVNIVADENVKKMSYKKALGNTMKVFLI